MSMRSNHGRMKSTTTRMDVLSNMLSSDALNEEEMPSVKDLSPRDSLSPLDHSFKENKNEGNSKSSPASRKSPPPFAASRSSRPPGSSSSPACADAGTRLAQEPHPPVSQQQEPHPHPHITFLEHGHTHKHAAATLRASTSPQHATCAPRSSPLLTRPHRPSDLTLTRSNGLTRTSTSELKQRIGDGHTLDDSRTTRIQVPRPKPPKRLPKTPVPNPITVPPPPVAMGNAHSSDHHPDHHDGVAADNASLNSVVRKPMRVLRKSSGNMFKRIDSRSPLPRPLTATSILVTQGGLAGADDDEGDDSPIDPFMDPAHKAREPVILHSDNSNDDAGAGEPLSAQTTLKQEAGRHDRTSPTAGDDASDCDGDEPHAVPAHRSSALSPTLPAPSPLPEDSPHKYGLRDRMDTPELVREELPPPEINVMKGRRRSSGLEIFNEAKSLQSAQSFLNGLSTSRRRAESTNRTTSAAEPYRPASRPGSRAHSAMHLHAPATNYTHPTNPPSTDNNTSYTYCRGGPDNFKPTSFAYSRPLALSQVHCYRAHDRLLPSRNLRCPVECAVCHMDDEQEHWTCSWCAIRMCRFCRKAFGKGGLGALRGRVKEAEIGSAASSTESLGRGRR